MTDLNQSKAACPRDSVFWNLADTQNPFLHARIAKFHLEVRAGASRTDGPGVGDDWTHCLGVELQSHEEPHRAIGSAEFITGNYSERTDLSRLPDKAGLMGSAHVSHGYFYATIAATRETIHDILTALQVNGSSSLSLSISESLDLETDDQCADVDGFQIFRE